MNRLPPNLLRHRACWFGCGLHHLARGGSRLLGPSPGQKLRIPPLAHVLMALDSIEQRGLAQMLPFPLAKGKLDVVNAAVARCVQLAQALVPHRQHGGRYIDALERGVVADALEEWHAEAGPGAGAGAQHTVRRAGADAVRERFETLADGDDKRARHGRTVDPGTREVLGLQASVGACLEEIRSKHGVLVGPDPLRL